MDFPFSIACIFVGLALLINKAKLPASVSLLITQSWPLGFLKHVLCLPYIQINCLFIDSWCFVLHGGSYYLFLLLWKYSYSLLKKRLSYFSRLLYLSKLSPFILLGSVLPTNLTRLCLTGCSYQSWQCCECYSYFVLWGNSCGLAAGSQWGSEYCFTSRSRCSK